MAYRPFFSVVPTKDFISGNGPFYTQEECEFVYFPGLSLSQKQKSIDSLHNAIHKINPNANILEVSTKSPLQIGRDLSAFNLKWKTRDTQYSVESLYQGSKVFQNGGPYTDLFTVPSVKAKTDERLKNSGYIKSYFFQGKTWPLSPQHLFYDYLYIKSLNTNKEFHSAVMEFDTFTDIEFNHKKSLNCQARALAIFVTLNRHGLVKAYLDDPEKFKTIYTFSDTLI